MKIAYIFRDDGLPATSVIENNAETIRLWSEDERFLARELKKQGIPYDISLPPENTIFDIKRYGLPQPIPLNESKRKSFERSYIHTKALKS